MAKGILFGTIHSYDDLNLILSAKHISPAKPKTNYIDIPGGNGSVDLTEANGEIVYYDRELSYTFTVSPSDELTWEERKTKVNNQLNGQVFPITDDDDPDYYYKGRCIVTDQTRDRNIKQIQISAQVAPYKLKQKETVRKFNLSNTPTVIKLQNSRKPVSPIVECSNNNTVISFGSATYKLNAGTYKLLDIRLVKGSNMLTVSGSGTIIFRYLEGDL